VKIYISADLEGISGVVDREQLSASGKDYARARKLMTGEVAACVRACLEAGAQEVLVNDAHGSMTNILIEDLPPGCRLITGSPKGMGMMEGIDERFDGAIFVGYHGRAGSGTVLNHTISGSTVYEVRVNEHPMGETGLNAALAGYYEVPLLLVTGDEGPAEEVKELDTGTRSVMVKRSRGRYSADCLPAEKAQEAIAEATREILGDLSGGTRPTPFKLLGSVRMDLQFTDTARADLAAAIPGVERTDTLVCSYTGKDYLDAYRVLKVMIAMGSR